MEALVMLRPWGAFGAIETMFKMLHWSGMEGEVYCLEKNLFVEKNIPGLIIRTMREEGMSVYRAPYPTRESRLPTLLWPREIPIKEEREPHDVYDLVTSYSAWLPTTHELPKLLVRATQGTILPPGGVEFAYAQSLSNQSEIEVPSKHFLQEDSPHQIGRSLRQFVARIRSQTAPSCSATARSAAAAPAGLLVRSV